MNADLPEIVAWLGPHGGVWKCDKDDPKDKDNGKRLGWIPLSDRTRMAARVVELEATLLSARAWIYDPENHGYYRAFVHQKIDPVLLSAFGCGRVGGYQSKLVEDCKNWCGRKECPVALRAALTPPITTKEPTP